MLYYTIYMGLVQQHPLVAWVKGLQLYNTVGVKLPKVQQYCSSISNIDVKSKCVLSYLEVSAMQAR